MTCAGVSCGTGGATGATALESSRSRVQCGLCTKADESDAQAAVRRGDRHVTGSCFLLETEQARVLVDCGMFQDPKPTIKGSALNTATRVGLASAIRRQCPGAAVCCSSLMSVCCSSYDELVHSLDLLTTAELGSRFEDGRGPGCDPRVKAAQGA